LTNLGTITGGNGANGGAGAPNLSFAGTGGNGGDGGAGVSFAAGGSLSNSGTISGGTPGTGGAAGISQTFGRNGLPGVAGSNGLGVIFTGAAGNLTNLSGGTINGGVGMGNFANTVTLDTGSVINGGVDMGTSGAAVLTLTGSGSRAYSAAVTGSTSLAGSLMKTGPGTWVLDRDFTYSGATAVNAGTLQLAGALGNTAVTVAPGAALAGAGSIGATGSLAFSDGSTFVALLAAPGGITVGGNLTFNGTIQLALSTLNVPRGPGQTIRLFTYGGTLTGSAANLAISGYRNLVVSTATGQVNVGFDTKDLTWFGSGAAWDLNTTANWNGGVDKFFKGDAVTFDDTGATKGVTVNGAVNPVTVAFTNSVGNDYTLGGPGSIQPEGTLTQSGAGAVTIGAAIAGGASVVKAGAGTLTLAGNNSYTGPTSVSVGTLSLTGTLSGTAIATTGSGFLSQGATGALIGSSSLTVGGRGTSVLAGADNSKTGATVI
jgi:autotransporter-associated beta strand protein